MEEPSGKFPTKAQNARCILLIALMYLIPSAQALLPVDDPDLWWRLRTGQWIVEHHAAPMVDYFSTYGMGKPWIEYSWLFELLTYAVHALFNLTGVVYFVVGMALLIAFVMHRLARRAGMPLVAEVALVAVAMAAIKPSMTPRPWLFSIFFFTVELLVIDHARRSEKSLMLWLLPIVFVFWANIHIQFIYGLALLGLLLAEALMVNPLQRAGIAIEAPALPPHRLLLVLLASVAATLVTPYHYQLYRQIFDYAVQTGAFENISELHPMFFRSPDNWLVLLLTVTTAFVIGWRRVWLPFPTAIFLMASLLAFRARRDAWVMALTAVWIVGDSYRALWPRRSIALSKGQIAASSVAVATMLLVLGFARQISEAELQAAVAKQFPVAAVDYVKAQKLPGPLFNNFDWGGFLIWSLPQLPVSIDGRSNIHGDEQIERSLNTWLGGPGWDSDPDLLRAKLVIADKQRVLVTLLRSQPGYKLVYEDNLAVVFVALK